MQHPLGILHSGIFLRYSFLIASLEREREIYIAVIVRTFFGELSIFVIYDIIRICIVCCDETLKKTS